MNNGADDLAATLAQNKRDRAEDKKARDVAARKKAKDAETEHDPANGQFTSGGSSGGESSGGGGGEYNEAERKKQRAVLWGTREGSKKKVKPGHSSINTAERFGASELERLAGFTGFK